MSPLTNANATMKTDAANQLPPDEGRIGSRMSRLDPDIFRSESSSIPETDADAGTETGENVFTDEPIDEKGNPTNGSDYSLNDGQSGQ